MLTTPLYAYHRSRAKKLIGFSGWSMPLYYSSILDEHMSVRKDCGVFDVSHMGKILLRSEDLESSLQRLSCNSVAIRVGACRYTHLLDEEGRIIDDVIVTRLSGDSFWCVCNAGTRSRVLTWFRRHLVGTDIVDLTRRVVCLALQGPASGGVLRRLVGKAAMALKPFRGARLRLDLAGLPAAVPQETEGWPPLGELVPSMGSDDPFDVYVTRTGYTGEDGFEIFAPNGLGRIVWSVLASRARPAGLGARDTLRLEKGYLLSGQDFDGSQTPLEVGYERIVQWDKDFFGKERLLQLKRRGDFRRLWGLTLEGSGVPRHGYEVVREGREVGYVTSGAYSPVLERGIALAYLEPDVAREGEQVGVRIRSRLAEATVTKPPFV